MATGNKKALIYGYIASVIQDDEDGHSNLAIQEKKGRAGANKQGLAVEAIFTDQAVKGGIFDRSGIIALLIYIEDHPDTQYVVIFDDMKRLARNLVDYLELKAKLEALGATLYCLNNPFPDTPEGQLTETLIAAREQYGAE